MEKYPLNDNRGRAGNISRMRIICYGVLASIFFYVIPKYSNLSLSHQDSPTMKPITDFSHLALHCANVPPIKTEEYLARQTKLAQTLHSLNASAYISEPGPTAQYFTNISLSDWHLSERPFLIVITPSINVDSLQVEAKTSIVTPKFEAARASLLPIPAGNNVSYAAWAEDASPYAAVASLLRDARGTIYVDEGARYFITDGIQKALSKNTKIESTPPEIKALRERKSAAEIDIMRCANEVTLLALRAVRKQLYIGIRESEVRILLHKTLSDAGLKDAWGLVLFGENAALPHGTGTDRILGDNDLILIDTGGSLHSYSSDLTRTFALKSSYIPEDHLNKWFLVQKAQRTAHSFAKEGIIASDVDKAAREVLKEAGFDQYFTHRLGHGIGLEMHESPYLRGGYNSTLAIGNTFSNEPGIYIEGELGIRLEDCFVIGEDRNPHFLTAGVGGSATSPWSP